MSSDELIPPWQPTLEMFSRYAAQAEQAAFLHGAASSGFLRRCRLPVSLPELATACDLREAVVGAACDLLVSMDVIDRCDDGRVVVSAALTPTLDDGVSEHVVARLEAAAVRARLLRDLFAGGDVSYWGLDTEQRTALAKLAGSDVRNRWTRDLVDASVHAVAGWHEALLAGARTLDMGCGVATRLVWTVATYPDIDAIGLDLSEDLLAIGRARAEELGVADRVHLLVADASQFRDPSGFDVIWWPQTFFARGTRAETMRGAFVNLRPGGLLVTVDPPMPRPESPDHGAAVYREDLIRALWDIPTVRGSELRDELADAGFVDISTPEVVSSVVLPYVTARRPA